MESIALTTPRSPTVFQSAGIAIHGYVIGAHAARAESRTTRRAASPATTQVIPPRTPTLCNATTEPFELTASRRRNTCTAVPIEVNAQDDHDGLLDCTDRKPSYPRELIVGDRVVLGWADVVGRRGGLAGRPKRGSMSGGPITAGCASAQVGLGGDHERRHSRP
jgi:hypothetical protein